MSPSRSAGTRKPDSVRATRAGESGPRGPGRPRDDGVRLGDIAYEGIHRLITTQLSPGMRLSEAELADDLGMSKTPVREALRRLESEGLVEAIPRVGYLIPQISYRDVREAFEVREAAEGCAARLAAERITAAELQRLAKLLEDTEEQLTGSAEHDLPLMRRFNHDLHEAIMEAADNRLLKEMLASVRQRIERSIDVFVRDDFARFLASLEEHKIILAALMSQDRDAAERAMRDHIQSVGQHILARFR